MTHFLGLCENLAPAGMDGRESTRIRTPVKTPKRFRSASSPFASPMSDAMLTGKHSNSILRNLILATVYIYYIMGFLIAQTEVRGYNRTL